jgi:hypothetical protein
MTQELEKLPPPEAELMLKAPLLVCILIAGADDDIDRKEIRNAIKLTQEKQQRIKSNLTEFYQLMAEDFEDKLKVLIQSFPSKAAQRNPLITAELQRLNNILTKLRRPLAIEFYKSLLEIAQKTAASSGGLLGIKPVGEEEAKLVTLPMIDDPANG